MTRFNLPDLGEGLQEAEIVRWHVDVGQRVAVDQPMVAMETAKAVVEVPSPYAGVVTALHGKPGDTVATGAPLVDFRIDSEATPTETPAAVAGGVVGRMPTSDQDFAEAPGPRERTGGARQRSRAVPAARDLARRVGVDLNDVEGSGRDGLITVDDVLRAAAPAAATPHPAAAPPVAKSSMRPAAPPQDDGELEVLRSLRRAMAQSMAMSRDSVMECTVFDDADVEGWSSGSDYTVRLLRAIAAGCRAEPGLNAWFDGSTGRRQKAGQRRQRRAAG